MIRAPQVVSQKTGILCVVCKKDKYWCFKKVFHEIFFILFYTGHKNVIFFAKLGVRAYAKYLFNFLLTFKIVFSGRGEHMLPRSKVDFQNLRALSVASPQTFSQSDLECAEQFTVPSRTPKKTIRSGAP
jgi:hypothetical protein